MTAMNLDQLASVWSQVEALAPGLLHPIETEKQYQQALETVDELMTRVNESEGGDPLESLLGILIERVAVYEESILPPREKKPAGILAHGRPWSDPERFSSRDRHRPEHHQQAIGGRAAFQC